jgi:hypothetical protein
MFLLFRLDFLIPFLDLRQDVRGLRWLYVCLAVWRVCAHSLVVLSVWWGFVGSRARPYVEHARAR